MSSQTFTSIERHAFWETYKCKCFYGEQPLRFQTMEIDHLIPEALGKDAAGLALELARLGLPGTFSLQSYENLVPACSICNGRKSNNPFTVGQMAIFLAVAARRAPEVRDAVKALNTVKSLDAIMRAAVQSIDRGAFTREQFQRRARDEGLLNMELATSVRLQSDFEFSTSGASEILKRKDLIPALAEAFRHGDISSERLRQGAYLLYRVRTRDGLYLTLGVAEGQVVVLGIGNHRDAC